MKKLSVNVDHVATLRQARREVYPDPVHAAVEAYLGGTDGITFHLRGDRRHIKERDVELIRKVIPLPLTMECGLDESIIEFGGKVGVDFITLVPERKEEITTEGGLDVIKHEDKIKKCIELMQKFHIKPIIFVEPDIYQVEKAAQVGAFAVEIHTGNFAKDKEGELEKIKEASRIGKTLGLEIHAGHGLDYLNIIPLLDIEEIVEYSIGFSIVAKSIFVGFRQAVSEMKRLINRGNL